MKHLKKYELFTESLKKYNFYSNINNFLNDENVEYHQIPFEFFKKEQCIKNSEDWVLCLNRKFYYDFIKDSDITKCLKMDLSKINITKDWSTQTKTIFAYENINIHTLRIAKLVLEMKNNKAITPVSMFFDDRSFIHSIPNYIEDGNHRIRAIKYLKYDGFPAFIHGNYSQYLIDFLKKINL